MIKYLLDGVSFHAKLRELRSNIDSTAMYIDFSNEEDIECYVNGLDTVNVDSSYDGSIKASITDDGKRVYVYSNYDIGCKNAQQMFSGMGVLCHVNFDNFDASECSNMRRMFYSCASLGYIDLECISTPKLTDCTEMFSGCSSCYSINIKSMTVDGVVASDNMFNGTKSLRLLSFGDKFTYKPSMGLANPDSSIVKGSNGKWNMLSNGTSYTAASIPSKSNGTFYAVDVSDEADDDSLVTVGAVREAAKQIAQAVSKQIRYFSS